LIEVTVWAILHPSTPRSCLTGGDRVICICVTDVTRTVNVTRRLYHRRGAEAVPKHRQKSHSRPDPVRAAPQGAEVGENAARAVACILCFNRADREKVRMFI
jgi:hypothetical protein